LRYIYNKSLLLFDKAQQLFIKLCN